MYHSLSTVLTLEVPIEAPLLEVLIEALSLEVPVEAPPLEVSIEILALVSCVKQL